MIQLFRFRCRIGHSYGSETLLASQSLKLDDAIWGGYRALEESAALAKRLHRHAVERGLASLAQRYQSRYDEAIGRAKTLRRVLERGQLDAAVYGQDQDQDQDHDRDRESTDG